MPRKPTAHRPQSREASVSDAVVPYIAAPSSSNGRNLMPVTGFRTMLEVTWADYTKFLKTSETVLVEGKNIRLEGHRRVKTFGPQQDAEQQTTVWSFRDRGRWATHKASYRGNWSPWVPRNLILKYSAPGDTVLDQMVGGGTTLVECRLLGRRGIGVDINSNPLMLAMDRLNFDLPMPMGDLPTKPLPEIKLFEGDARHLDAIPPDSVDLIATHPPYANIIPYSKAAPIEGDLSQVHTLNDFFSGMASSCGGELASAQTGWLRRTPNRRHPQARPLRAYGIPRHAALLAGRLCPQRGRD